MDYELLSQPTFRAPYSIDQSGGRWDPNPYPTPSIAAYLVLLLQSFLLKDVFFSDVTIHIEIHFALVFTSDYPTSYDLTLSTRLLLHKQSRIRGEEVTGF